MGKLTCDWCAFMFKRKLPGPVDIVVCPHCKQKVEIHQMNTTSPPQTMLLIRVLKEGKENKKRRKEHEADYYQ